VRIPVAFGQYVPADSPVHTMDARAKMGAGVAFAVAMFLVDGLPGLLVMALLLAGAVRLSEVPLRVALRGLKALTLLLTFTLLAHALRWGVQPDVLVALGPLTVTAGGLLRGVFFALRVMLLVVGTSLLTLTTTPVELTDALERLMRPLELVRFPAGEVAMMLTIALRFIPTTAQEAERIIIAQSARGARFDEGGPIRRIRAFVPVLVPLFVNLFKRAEDLAVAMESRCYRGGVGRTRLYLARMTARDWAAFGVSAALVLAVGWML